MTIDSVAEKPALRRLEKGDVVDAGSGPTDRSLLRAFATLAQPEQLLELHSMEPWWIMQSKPNCERIAVDALARNGFEAWYPTYRHFSRVPLRKIASNMRHKAKNKIQMRVRMLMPGYILIRRLFGSFDVYRLYDLDGCGGLCVLDGDNGEVPATLADHEVEILRLRVASRADDVYSEVAAGFVMKTGFLDDPRAMKQWTFKTPLVGRLDESVRTSLFIARGDRIIRVIRSADDVKRCP